MRAFLGGFVAGGGTVTVVVVLARRSRIRKGASLEASTPEASHPALKHGVPTSERLRIFDGYVACVDPARRTPKWVLERVRREDLEGGSADRSRSEFFEDTELEPYLRPHLADYQASSYDRGHLAPAMNHKGSQRRLDQTFCLSNIAPQVGAGFNRDYWARFEHFVRGLAWSADNVYVVTGPLFAPSKQRNGKVQMVHDILGSFPFHISVPTHFYKVVLTESRDDRSGKRRAAVGAFVIPNSPVPPDQPITAFAFPLTMLEAAAGVRFFPLFLTPARRRGLDAAAMDVRKRAALQPGGKAQLPDSAALELELASTALAKPGGSQPEAAPSGASASLAEEPRKSGHSVSHLCDNVKCRLPPERFWEKGPRNRRQQRLSR